MPTLSLPQPLVFEPLFMERVWGGHRLEFLYHKRLPHGMPIGESWEIVDREEAQSVVHAGLYKGATLQELWTNDRAEIFGVGLPETPRFPLLLKLLDANDALSLQVHPPAAIAKTLGGEAKTEMWYVTHTEPGAEIFAGLRPGTTRKAFEEAIAEGRTAEFVHRFHSHEGDAFFIPSGRLHAIGGGNVIVEVMQNSDTTYRVSDWNRVGLDGQPRPLHIAQSLQAIRFDDFAPEPQRPAGETLVECEFFRVEKWDMVAPRKAITEARFAIFTVLSGRVDAAGATFRPGDFFLVPALVTALELAPLEPGTQVLRTTIPI